MRLTVRPRLSSRHPIEAAANPLPREDTTPPVTKMYFADIGSSHYILFGILCSRGAQPIMPEKVAVGNGGKVRFKLSAFSHQLEIGPRRIQTEGDTREASLQERHQACVPISRGK